MNKRISAAIFAFALTLVSAPTALAVTEVPGDAGFTIAGSRTAAGLGIVQIRADENNNATDYERIVGTFYPYGPVKVGEGVRVATGDFNGDGNDELVVATSNGLPVKIYALNSDGTIGDFVESKSVFGKRGAYVAAGDVNGDGRDELVVGAGIGKPGLVRIFSDTDLDGKVLDNQTDSFTAFSSGFTGGVTVAAGNTTNSLGDEVVMGMASKGQQVRIRTDADLDRAVSDSPPLETFTNYPSSYKNGVNVAAGPIENAGGNGNEVITAPVAGKRKVVIRTDTNANGLVSGEASFEQFYAFGSKWAKGVRIAAGDTDHSSFFVEVLTAPGGSSNKQRTRVRDDTADVGAKISDNAPKTQFKAMPSSVKAAGTWIAFAVVRTSVYTLPGFPVALAENATTTIQFSVPPSAGRIRDLDVGLNIFHTFNGDLDVTMTHVPSGVSLVLFTDVGGTDEGFVIRLNDEAGTDIGTANNPTDGVISGTFNPEDAALLSAFDGIDASGLWRLTVVDDTAAGADVGTLFGWTLFVTN